MRSPLLVVSLVLLLVGCDSGELVEDAGSVDGASSDAGPPDGGPCMPFEAPADDLASERAACTFGPGATVEDTLGIDRARAARIPITHVIVVTQENRSFDHLLGSMEGVDGIPADYTNPDLAGNDVAPFHLASTCLEADPPHQWDAMQAQWNGGAMDRFVRTAATGGSDGHYAVGYYDETDLPFTHWAARTFAMSDRFFASALAGTWSNRNFLYTGSSYGVRDTGERTIPEAETIFDQLDAADVTWGVYTDGFPRQDSLGWGPLHRGRATVPDFLAALADGSLPSVTFVDPNGAADQHPANDVQPGEEWVRSLYEAARASRLWPSLAMIFTYDEGGGLFDHAPPPDACAPSPEWPEFDRLGHRVPLVVLSPWARPGHVSHEVASHTSILRFVQLLFDLPALSARDASSNALLDLFELDCDPDLLAPPDALAAGTGGCP